MLRKVRLVQPRQKVSTAITLEVASQRQRCFNSQQLHRTKNLMSHFSSAEIMDQPTSSYSHVFMLGFPVPCLAPLQSVRSFLQVLELLRGSTDLLMAWPQRRSVSSHRSDQRLCGWIRILTWKKIKRNLDAFFYHSYLGHFGGSYKYIKVLLIYMISSVDSMAMIRINLGITPACEFLELTTTLSLMLTTVT